MKKTAFSFIRGRWLLLCALLPFAAPAPAQGGPVSEYQVKAVYLFNFARFTAWPLQTFSTPHFNLCILGEDPFQVELDVAVENEKAKGRTIQIQRLRALEDVAACQILFVSRSEQARQQEILAYLAGRPILSVSEIEGFAQVAGGMVEFYKQGNKVRFYIAPDQTKHAGLRIDANLLRIATVVDSAK